MHEDELRRALKAGLSACDFPQDKQREVLNRIQGGTKPVKRKISAGLALAMLMTLLLGGAAVAATLGLFGQIGQDDANEYTRVRLSHLDDAAEKLDVSVSVAAPTPDAAPQADDTLYDQIAAYQAERTFDLTIHQAYSDGHNLYYSYTLKTDRNGVTFEEGRPSGFDSWEWAEPGKRLSDVWSFDPPEKNAAMAEWFAHAGARYAIMDNTSLGDGCSIADGSEKGVYTMIVDSAEEWIDETTLQGFQQVELPQDYEPGDQLDLLMPVYYGTTVFYQDETGAYRTHIAQQENRGILRIPFSVTVGGSAAEMTGAIAAQGYAAHATLTFTDVTAYGEVVFDAPKWAAAWQAKTDYWLSGEQGQEPVMPDMITNYQLVADGETLRNIGGGFGLNEDGQYYVFMEFDLPQTMTDLTLVPEDAAFKPDVISLR